MLNEEAERIQEEARKMITLLKVLGTDFTAQRLKIEAEAKKAMLELYDKDPDTQREQLKIAQFLMAYPMLNGLSYQAADILRKEKDEKIRNIAIKRVGEEIAKRKDVHSKKFRAVYMKVSQNRVKKILTEVRESVFPLPKRKNPSKTWTELKCPSCGEPLKYTPETRSNVVSLRTTESEENAIEYLANITGLSKSSLIEALLKINLKFGRSIR